MAFYFPFHTLNIHATPLKTHVWSSCYTRSPRSPHVSWAQAEAVISPKNMWGRVLAVVHSEGKCGLQTEMPFGKTRSVSFTQGQVIQKYESRPSEFHPTLHLSTLRASPGDTGRGTVSCWLRNRHTACPLDMASPCKGRWTLGTVLLWQKETHMISTQRITLHSRGCWEGSRAGL